MTTITKVIPEFSGPAPSTADPTNFDARTSTLLSELIDFPTDVNEWSGQTNTVAGEVNSAAAAAAISATTAREAADAVLAQGTTADAWSGATTYDPYDVAIGSDGAAYRSLAGANTNHDPTTDDGTWWRQLNPDPNLAALLMMSADMYPGWDVQAEGPAGTYPPTDPSKPACKVWSNGVERYRSTFTWGTTGGSINAPETIVCEYSSDSGVTYNPITATNQANVTYDTSGAVIKVEWSAET